MKKIMFNDRYGLTEAVLEGRKTMTRRIVKEMAGREYKKLPQIQEDCNDGSFLVFKDADDLEPIILYPKYKIGEVVAVAQKYSEMNRSTFVSFVCENGIWKKTENSSGWSNKMFVQVDLMPHQIRITNIRIERLQDISDEDCLREGIESVYYGDEEWFKAYDTKDGCKCAPTPKEAFAALIDRVSGKGTWKSNPWVYAYEFELVK